MKRCTNCGQPGSDPCFKCGPKVERVCEFCLKDCGGGCPDSIRLAEETRHSWDDEEMYDVDYGGLM